MSIPRSRPAPLHRLRRMLLLALATTLVPQLAGASQLQLSWVDNSGGEGSFRIERKTGTDGTYAEVALEGPSITTYADTTVVDGTTYCYRVQAYDAGGVSGYSNEACGSTATGLTLTVSVSGTGKGTVSSTPTGISCGTDCTETYGSGLLVTLSAAAASGSTFGGWSGGGCAGTGTCTLTGNTPVTVGATFAAAPASASYTPSVTKSAPGPAVSIATNNSVYSADDRMVVTVSTNPGLSTGNWYLVVAFLTPVNTPQNPFFIYRFNPMVELITLQTGLARPSFGDLAARPLGPVAEESVVILDVTLPPLPIGAYQWLAALFSADLTAVSTVAAAPFHFQ
jgi:Divergent InlB B-repeat domain